MRKIPIGYHESIKPPLTAQYGVERRVLTSINPIHLVIRTHDGAGVRLRDGGAKRRIINLAQRALTHPYINCGIARRVAESQRFLIVGDEVFWRGNDMATLNAVDDGGAELPR